MTKIYFVKSENIKNLLIRKDNLLAKGKALSAIGKETNQESNKIESSFELSKQVLDQLTTLGEDDFKLLHQQIEGDTRASSHVRDLINLDYNDRHFKYWRDVDVNSLGLVNNQVVGINDNGHGHVSAAQLKIQRIYEICLNLIKLNAVGRALKCASEMPCSNILFPFKEKGLQGIALGYIAGALAQKGYFGQALEIANKDIYAGDAAGNLHYKVFVLQQICLGLEELNCISFIREMLNQIPETHSTKKTNILQHLIKSCKMGNRLENAIQIILFISDLSVRLQEMKSMGEEFFNKGDLESAESVARATKHHLLLARIVIAWSDRNDFQRAQNIVLKTPTEEKMEVIQSIMIFKGQNANVKAMKEGGRLLRQSRINEQH